METIEDRLKHIAAVILSSTSAAMLDRATKIKSGDTDEAQHMWIDQESIDYEPESMCICFKCRLRHTDGQEPADLKIKFPMVLFRNDSSDEEIEEWLKRRGQYTMEAINDVLAEMRSNEFDSPAFDKYALNSVRCLAKDWANRIEVAQKAYNKEVVELLKGVIEGVCQHCDMQDACAEGEDGISTTCNAVAKAKHFIEQHSEPELNDDQCPF